MTMVQDNEQFYLKIDECRLCDSKNLYSVLDLGDQPPANHLRKELKDLVPHAPLKLLQCGDCSGVQLSATVSPAYLFSEYVWVTATSATARSYSEKYCSEVLNRSKIQSPFVLEIASNDGTFLKRFKDKGCEVLGVDPAKNIAVTACAAGVPTLAEFFDAAIANKILLEHKRPNIVMARNVIPHVKEIHSIIKGMSTLVDDDGMVVIEFHYAKIIAEELHYDSIYHEHLFYFSIKSLMALLEQYDLYPFDAFPSPISGGSLVLFFSKKHKQPSNALKELIDREDRDQLNDLATWQRFGELSKKHAENLRNIVAKYANSNRLIAYGASARSSTLLNFAKISSNEIECIVDRNPIKHGLYTPGANIPIVSYEEGLIKLQGKHLLLLAWNFEEEIVRDLRASGFNGDIVIPLPNEVRIR